MLLGEKERKLKENLQFFMISLKLQDIEMFLWYIFSRFVNPWFIAVYIFFYTRYCLVRFISVILIKKCFLFLYSASFTYGRWSWYTPPHSFYFAEIMNVAIWRNISHSNRYVLWILICLLFLKMHYFFVNSRGFTKKIGLRISCLFTIFPNLFYLFAGVQNQVHWARVRRVHGGLRLSATGCTYEPTVSLCSRWPIARNSQFRGHQEGNNDFWLDWLSTNHKSPKFKKVLQKGR